MRTDTASSSRIPRVWPFKRTYYGWAIVAAALAASFGQAPVFGPVLGVFVNSIEEELGWNRTTITAAFTIGTLTGSLMTYLFGRLLDRYGSRFLVTGTGLVIAGSLLGMAAMTEPWHLWVSFGLGRGSALAGIQIGTSIAISNWFVRKRGRAIALRGVGQRSGQAIVPLIILAFMTLAGWRWAFVALSGLAVVAISLPALLYLRRRPEDLGLRPDGDEAESEEDQRAHGPRHRVVEDVSFTLKEARRTRAFWAVLVFVSVDRFALGSVNIHMVANFTDKGISEPLAISVLSIFAATSALTVVPWGFLLERLHVRHGAALIALLFMACMGIIIVADNYVLAVAFGLLFGLAVGGSTVTEHLLFANYFGRAHQGEIRGAAAPFRMVSPFGPVFAAFLYDTTQSYLIAFLVFLGIFAIMFVAMLLATPPKKPERVEPAG